ncbi:PucR family transcriptional regulator [Anaerovorax sp. IOR16]|uniref:PucR family transcriptional regulator n=1 Tax=Anaerovorax sp. IOR16 TaxID=2773458 RepID=UPI0019D03FC3|nr:PucR family transcriptional regulator [Anaerovorax sp. IOR16]
MSLTIADAYKLKSLQNVTILTGQSGFQNVIDRMSILDYEFISYKMQGEFIKNDFVLSSFLFAKDDVNLLIAAVKSLIDNGVSCLGIKNVYYKDLPEDLISYAKEKSFSIFLFGHDIYFEDIITEVTDTLRLIDNNQLLEMKVDNLIGNELSRSLVRELALDINSNFKERFVVLYCKTLKHTGEGTHFRALERLKNLDYFKKEHSIFKYNQGMLAILTFDNLRKINSKKIAQEFWLYTALDPDNYILGVSDCLLALHQLDKGIQQSLYACKVCEIQQNRQRLYEEIGLYKVILPFQDSFWLNHYYKSILSPLEQYDEKYSADLLKTAISYVNNDGNIRKTAEALFQHENTIRYRLNKIKEILSMGEDNSSFYPQLCFAVQIYELESFV